MRGGTSITITGKQAMRGTHKVFICFLLPILFVAGALGPARAQQQEKRIALVIGNGAYARGRWQLRPMMPA